MRVRFVSYFPTWGFHVKVHKLNNFVLSHVFISTKIFYDVVFESSLVGVSVAGLNDNDHH